MKISKILVLAAFFAATSAHAKTLVNLVTQSDSVTVQVNKKILSKPVMKLGYEESEVVNKDEKLFVTGSMDPREAKTVLVVGKAAEVEKVLANFLYGQDRAASEISVSMKMQSLFGGCDMSDEVFEGVIFNQYEFNKVDNVNCLKNP